ncbi:DegV family protein [Bacillus horti]|uniref:DegV family protein with EDD domain n=1 Tax=Caldalkalibacillus horti TaxID=77523 RepID=A0ABT9W3B6_9BACI|nr:DegV family protein [Bacillus horti]MDQ0167729.1 DegV family protein with EDD domain [Bacillus horti]
MAKIKIVTDSTVDMTEEMLRKYDIEVVPLSITIDGQTYLDRVDLSPDTFIEKMRETQELPKSSQPPVGEFVEVYERLAKAGFDVLSIHITGSMSGTVQSAQMAADMAEANVKVIDSRFISKALSFQVIEAARMAKEGHSLEEIIARLDQIREQTRLFLMVDTLDNLVKGGRIGRASGFIGSILKIKPIAALEDGALAPVTKVRSYSQVIKHFSEQFAEDIKGKTVKGIGIAHAEALELATKLKASLSSVTDFKNIEIEFTTPIISTHTGPGAIGFMYYFDKK